MHIVAVLAEVNKAERAGLVVAGQFGELERVSDRMLGPGLGRRTSSLVDVLVNYVLVQARKVVLITHSTCSMRDVYSKRTHLENADPIVLVPAHRLAHFEAHRVLVVLVPEVDVVEQDHVLLVVREHLRSESPAFNISFRYLTKKKTKNPNTTSICSNLLAGCFISSREIISFL